MANKTKKVSVITNRIREVYRLRGISQAELARRLFHAGYYNYSEIKNAIQDFNKEFKSGLFTPDKLNGMAKILDCDPRYLTGTLSIPYDDFILMNVEKDILMGMYAEKNTGKDLNGNAIPAYSFYEADANDNYEVSKLKDYLTAIESSAIVYNPNNSEDNPSLIYTLSECFETITYEELNEVLKTFLVSIAQQIKFPESEDKKDG